MEGIERCADCRCFAKDARGDDLQGRCRLWSSIEFLRLGSGFAVDANDCCSEFESVTEYLCHGDLGE